MVFSLLISCSETLRDPQQSLVFTVKIINSSQEKVLIRYQVDESEYTFRFVDAGNELKFTMDGNLVIQYTIQNFDDAKYLRIKQHTLIQVKDSEIFIDDLPEKDILLENKK